MSETLTYTESEPSSEGQVVLNESEQEALEIGEQMEQDNGKLAGKFDSPEQLEKAYMELQSKLGSSQNSTENSEEPYEVDESEPEETDDTEYEVDTSFLDQLYEEAQGEPSEETIQALENMSASEIADLYVQYRQQVESQPQVAADFTEAQTDALYGMVGGREQYQQLTSWANDNLSQDEIAMFDAVMERGDANAAFWAIRSLAMQYADVNGYEGQRISGKAPVNNANQFRSQAELVQAMSDPRYDNDDAYRADVMQRLENSDLSF